jgi:RHH-type transcriptional regulator, rel operon repressor / antitoxin RelB
MTKDVTLSLRIDRKLSDKLERRARQTKRSKSSLAALAIENFLTIEAMEVAKTERALARAKAGGPFASHEDVVRWMESWGTENELPRPKATIKF